MEIATWIHNFSWPCHVVLSSRPYLTLLLLLGWEGSQLGVVVNRRLAVGRSVLSSRPYVFPFDETYRFSPEGSLSADTTDRCKLALTECNSDWNFHVCICIYSFITLTISVQHMTATTYFYMCLLCREYLINRRVKGQYKTVLYFRRLVTKR